MPPTPPRPGASSEEVFVCNSRQFRVLTLQRYHLTMELQKLGSAPDKALIDRLVKQHFPLVQKQRERAVEANTPLPSLEVNAVDALGSTAELGELQNGSEPFSTTCEWDTQNGTESTDLTSDLLNLDFAEDTHEATESPLYAPPFMDPIPPPNDVPNFSAVSAFREPSVEQPNEASESIDPQLVLSLTQPNLPEVAPAAPVSHTGMAVKREPSPLEPIQEQAEPTEPTFTAFTPLRLDRTPLSRMSNAEPCHASPDTENLRPSLEEYNKLSSKEKRQLRNKISARNFRNRRKGM